MVDRHIKPWAIVAKAVWSSQFTDQCNQLGFGIDIFWNQSFYLASMLGLRFDRTLSIIGDRTTTENVISPAGREIIVIRG